MNDPKLAAERLREIISTSYGNKDLSEKSGLYSAARFLLDDIREHFTPDDGQINGYTSEKIRNVRWHIAAALGFDIDNGHDDSQHRVWALGDLGTLSNLIDERSTDDD